MSEFAAATKSSSLSVICVTQIAGYSSVGGFKKRNALPLQDRLIFVVFGWCLGLMLMTNSPKLTIDEVVLYKIPLDSPVAIQWHLRVTCISLSVTNENEPKEMQLRNTFERFNRHVTYLSCIRHLSTCATGTFYRSTHL